MWNWREKNKPIKPWPEDGLEPVEACPICNSKVRTLLYADLTDRVFRCAPGSWNLYRCPSCGTGYLDPRPTQETVGLAYEKYFTHNPASKKATHELSPFHRLRRALANGFRNARFGTDYKPHRKLGVWVARLLPRQRALLEAEGRHLPRPAPGATLLDVGCGNGEFLNLARNMGWKVEGLDVDSRAVEIARSSGLTVHHGGIEVLNGQTERFDVITLGHVIEHVHDPVGLLKACHRLLKPDGLLWLETPNVESYGHACYGRHWLSLDPPRHLTLFTWDSICLALNKAGLERVKPLPSQPVARHIFATSEAIMRDQDPYNQAVHSLPVRCRAWRAEILAARDLRLREFITLKARKVLLPHQL